MNDNLAPLDDAPVTAPERTSALVFHARGHLEPVITGLVFGAFLLPVAAMMARDEMMDQPPDLNAIAIGARFAGPLFMAFVGVLMLALGAVHVVRRKYKPIAFRMDREGVEGFLLFGRRRIAWRDITEVKYQGAWIHFISGRKKLYLNTDQLSPIDGHDPAVLIDYFLQGVLNR